MTIATVECSVLCLIQSIKAKVTSAAGTNSPFMADEMSHQVLNCSCPTVDSPQGFDLSQSENGESL